MKIVIIGNGRMGHEVAAEIEKSDDLSLSAMLEFAQNPDEIPLADVLIDFSHPNNLPAIAEYAEKDRVPLVIGTTGLGDEALARVRRAAAVVPVVRSANFSVGVTILTRLAAELSPFLAQFDAEITETHHHFKADAPSGTAKMLVEALDPNHEYERVYGRGGIGARGKEIGIHALRGGTVAGTHVVSLFGEDETIAISHEAQSRRIFARGALTAARFAVSAKPGEYSMNDVLFGGKQK